MDGGGLSVDTNAVSGSARFHAGDRARVRRGQFEGCEVEVVAVDDVQQAVRVSMMVFDRLVPLTFSFTEAEGLLEVLLVAPETRGLQRSEREDRR
jgi:transcription antitermination factor NusG